MNYYRNGKQIICTIGTLDLPEITAEEYEAEMQRVSANMEANAERGYWTSIPYDEAVDTEIRKRYSVSAEFAILRQRDEKPEEYAAYYAYCEECKEHCKQMREKYT